MYPVLHHQQAFRLDKTVEIKNYFIGGIIEREMVSKYISLLLTILINLELFFLEQVVELPLHHLLLLLVHL